LKTEQHQKQKAPIKGLFFLAQQQFFGFHCCDPNILVRKDFAFVVSVLHLLINKHLTINCDLDRTPALRVPIGHRPVMIVLFPTWGQLQAP
jgi:hypothetical protein